MREECSSRNAPAESSEKTDVTVMMYICNVTAARLKQNIVNGNTIVLLGRLQNSLWGII